MGQDMVAMRKLPEDLGRNDRRNIIDALDKRMEGVGGSESGTCRGGSVPEVLGRNGECRMF